MDVRGHRATIAEARHLIDSPLRFHWRLIQKDEPAFASRAHHVTSADSAMPHVAQQSAFCRAGEDAGIEGMLTNFGWHEPDAIILTTAVAMNTTRMKFIIAYRSGLICPTTFVQQINTLSTLVDGRIAINVVAGHSPEEQRYYGDYLPHDERYARTEEFLDVCNRFWYGEGEVDFDGRYYKIERGKLRTPFVSSDGARGPELYIAGNSEEARRLAISQGSCWMMMADAPSKIAPKVGPVLHAGRSVGVRLAIVGGRTRAESLDAAREMAIRAAAQLDEKSAEQRFVGNTDAVSLRTTYALADHEWLTPWLWTGLVRTHGAPCVALVGSPDDIADGLMEFKSIGVTQFILSGWPKLDEMLFFGREILPRVRERESAMAMERRRLGGWSGGVSPPTLPALQRQ
jgi:alkanesulfonate monooxygenase